MNQQSLTASMQWLFAACCISGIVMYVGLGCKPAATVDSADDHGEEHDHPETYAAALTEIKERRESIQNAFAANNAEEADNGLHEVGHLLEDLKHLAEHAGLTGDDLTAVNDAADRVFDAYGELHPVVHDGGEIPDGAYDGVAETIDSGIAELEAKLSLIETEADHEEHEGHDEHDHNE